jgi:alpha-tubulin suppressor-like RCC1 family protein
LSNVVAIAAGFRHNLAVKSDGTVFPWGYNEFGQCTVPPGLSNVVDVAAGTYHSLALVKNGTVVAWGHGSWGETNVPAGLTNAVGIAAGGDPQNGTYEIYEPGDKPLKRIVLTASRSKAMGVWWPGATERSRIPWKG